jgi:hypothetical protein
MGDVTTAVLVDRADRDRVRARADLGREGCRPEVLARLRPDPALGLALEACSLGSARTQLLAWPWKRR